MKQPTIDDLRDLIAQARNFLPGAIIAGGAVRDVLEGVPVKDIDIFVDVERVDDRWAGESVQAVRQFSLLLESSFTPHAPGSDEYESTLFDLDRGPDFPQVQVILIDRDPVDDVYAFDFDLSMCFVTPAGVFTTPQYRDASRLRTISYRGNHDTPFTARQRSLLRLERLKNKYRGWSFFNTAPLLAVRTEVELAKSVGVLL